MKQRKRRFETFPIYNATGICRHLEKMAARGWMIERMSSLWWTYRRIEPRNLRFAISNLPNLSQFDPDNLEERQEFLDFCAHDGWQLACSTAQVHIFWNEEENPTPLETDPKLELQSIRASVRKGFLPGTGLLLLIAVVQLYLFVSHCLENPVETLSNSLQVFAVTAFAVSGALCVTELICYFLWSRRAEKMAPLGSLPPTADAHCLEKGITFLLLILLLVEVIRGIVSGRQTGPWILAIPACLFLLVLIQAMQALRDWLRSRGASRGANRALVAALWITGSVIYGVGIVFLGPAASAADLAIRGAETYTVQGRTYTAYHDPVPLTLADLTGEQSDFCSTRRTGDQTIFLSRYIVTQEPRQDAPDDTKMPWFRYEVVSVRWPALYDICKNDLLESGVVLEQYTLYSYIPADPAPWGAEEAYQRQNNEGMVENSFLLCYNNLLVTIEFDWAPSQEQMAITGRKLASAADS